MKITRVEPILIAVPYEHGGPKPMRPFGPWTHMETLFVRVDTDAGITGWGEAFGFAASALTREAILRVVAPLCEGREFTDVPAFMADLQRKLHAMGRHGPVSFALAGIDIALWDIAGKAQGVPIHRLLGGATRDRIPTYASLLRYGKPDLVARYTKEAIGRGYTSIKLHEHLVETVAPAREAAGPDIALMVDTNCAWPPDEAIEMARKLKAYDLAWLEEPVDPVDDYDTMARIRRDTGVTIAAGENIGHAAEARLAIDAWRARHFPAERHQDRRHHRHGQGDRRGAAARHSRHAAFALFRPRPDRDARTSSPRTCPMPCASGSIASSRRRRSAPTPSRRKTAT